MIERRTKVRTHYIHRISYSAQERIVGLFVIIAVGTLLWLLISSGRTQEIFEDSITLYGQLETADGLSKDIEVKVAGIRAGVIERIEIKNSNRVLVEMSINSEFHDLIRVDSQARLSNPGIAVLGQPVIEISPGNRDKPIIMDGDTIRITQAPGMKQALDQVTPTLLQLHDTMLRINDILQSINPESIGYTFESLRLITADMQKITRHIQRGNGMIGGAIYDKDIRRDTEELLGNLVDITRSMEEIVATLNKEIANMPELVDRLGPILKQADETIKATQRIWPLSSAIGEKQEEDTLTTPVPAND